MIFQALDDKESCVAICANGKLYYSDFPELTGTWDYNSALHHPDIEYAKLYCEGVKIEEVKNKLIIHGLGLNSLKKPNKEIYLGKDIPYDKLYEMLDNIFVKKLN